VFDPRGGHRAQACLGFLNYIFGNFYARSDVEEGAHVLFAAVIPFHDEDLLGYMCAVKVT
jgi:hypothetical protein